MARAGEIRPPGPASGPGLARAGRPVLPLVALVVLSCALLLPGSPGVPARAAGSLGPSPTPALLPLPAPTPEASGAANTTETPEWVNLTSVLPAPTDYINPLLAYDPAIRAAVYFGGLGCLDQSPGLYGCLYNYYAQATWEYSGGAWVNVSSFVGAPAPADDLSGAGALAYDPGIGELVLFSQTGLRTSGQYNPIYTSTWLFGDRGWYNLTLDPSSEPSSVRWMVYDPDTSSLVAVADNGSTWAFTSASWQYLSARVPADLMGWPGGMAYDPATESVILAGVGRAENATWSYTSAGWTNVSVEGQAAPTGVGGEALPLVYDADLGGLVEVAPPANRTLTGTPVTTWVYRNGGWADLGTDLGPVPPPVAYTSGAASATFPGFSLFLDPTVPVTWPATATWALTEEPIPFLRATPTQAETNQSIAFSGTSYGGEGPYQVALEGLPPGCVAEPLPFVCRPTSAGTYAVNLTVTDAEGRSGSSVVSLDLATGLAATFEMQPSVLDLGETWTLTTTARAGAPPYDYSYPELPPGCVSAFATVIDCRPTDVGRFAVEAVVTDASGVRVSWNGSVVVQPDPTISLTANYGEVEVGEPAVFWWNATVAEGLPSWGWSGLPAGCAAPAAPPLVCVPSAAGSYQVSLTVRDDTNRTAVASVALTVVPSLDLTSFSLVPGTHVSGGSGVIFLANTSGGIGPLTYEYDGLPGGCPSVNASVLGCTPASGSWTVVVRVTDARGVSVTSELNLTVGPTTSPLLWSVAGGAAAVGAVGVVAAVVTLRQRRPAPPPPEADERVYR